MYSGAMKKILACIHSEDHLSKVAAFCEQERLSLSSSDKPSFSENDAPVFFITDDKSMLTGLKGSGVPLCIISEERQEGGVFYLKEAFGVYHLRMLLDAIYHGGLVCNYAPSVMPVAISKDFLLENDYNNMDRIVCAMTAELPFFFSFSDLEKVRVGVSEMITNAMEHGNLAITGHEKMESTENGTYYELLDKRMKDPKYSSRKTAVSVRCADGVLSIVIKDSGSGFDTSKIPDPTDTERLLKLHGRGIFIARMYFDEITYNEKGNEVTLLKRIGTR